MLVLTVITKKEAGNLLTSGELTMRDITKSPTVNTWRKGKRKPIPQMVEAYEWMASKLAAKDSRNKKDLSYPRWVWCRYDGIEGEGILERMIEMEGMYRDAVACLFDIPEEEVLKSDHTDWHQVLSHSYVSLDEEWDEEGDLMVDPSEEEIIKSWDRVLETNPADRHQFVQGVVWRLRKKNLRKIKLVRRCKPADVD